MALCPFAVQKPVSAHGGAVTAHLGLVLHVTAGEGDPFYEFANPNNQVSSHFGIGNGQGGFADGALEQYVDTANQSWAQAAGNSTYVSVETEGQPTEALSAAQIATLANLYVWLNSTHGIPYIITDTPGMPGFITHGDGGNAWGGHFGCPGPLRTPQRSAVLSLANPPTQSGAEMQTEIFEFKTGVQYDALQVIAGTLFHCWSPLTGPNAGKWSNEPVAGPAGGKSGATLSLTGEPKYSILSTDLFVTVEDTSGGLWGFGQPNNSGGWGTVKLR